MPNLKFSVVIPAYNAALSIAETLESVSKQSWREFEVVVADDASTDATPDIVLGFAKRDSRIRLLPCPQHFGRPAGPRNLGMRQATGDYIAFLDSDDIWKSEKLAHDAAFLTADPVDFLFSGCEYFVNSLDNIVAVLDPAPMSKMILFRNLVMIQTVCVSRRLILERQLFFDEDPQLRGIEDYHFVLEAYLSNVRMARRPGSDVLYRKVFGDIHLPAQEFAAAALSPRMEPAPDSREVPTFSCAILFISCANHVLQDGSGSVGASLASRPSRPVGACQREACGRTTKWLGQKASFG